MLIAFCYLVVRILSLMVQEPYMLVICVFQTVAIIFWCCIDVNAACEVDVIFECAKCIRQRTLWFSCGL